jgi:stress-induced morphogen
MECKRQLGVIMLSDRHTGVHVENGSHLGVNIPSNRYLGFGNVREKRRINQQ